MRKLNWVVIAGLIVAIHGAQAGVKFLNGSSTVIGTFSEVNCRQGVNCASVGGALELALGQQEQNSGTSTVMSVYKCGTTYISSGSTTVTLPLAADALGCRYTFVVGASASMDIKPNAADQIQVLTNAAGDKIRNATVGSSIILQASAAGSWIAVGKEQGTWSDVN